MSWSPDAILAILDGCAKDMTFPMLDNGYVYLAASRMSVYHSISEWALIIEVFGYSPRSGLPDTHIHTYCSALKNQPTAANFVSQQAFENYMLASPNNRSSFVFPIEDGLWIDQAEQEYVDSQQSALVRGRIAPLPALQMYLEQGIVLEEAKPKVFEFCRWLAATNREVILASETEREAYIPNGLNQILQLEEWHHPDLVRGEMPSDCETFLQLANVLSTGDVSFYQPTKEPNTDWVNWPDGGTL